MSKSFTGGLTSIIVPACDQRSFTQLCLQALFEHTRPPCELIVFDNESTDGTGLYLEGVRDSAPVPLTVIANGENLAFPRAINQGLRAARLRSEVLAECAGDGEAHALLGRLARPQGAGCISDNRPPG
jgi:glycosyltransferase involved in cell wall biosynthesis